MNWDLSAADAQIAKLGKPMLVADEYLGGSGVFLCGYSGLRRQGMPAGAVSTTRPEDLVAVGPAVRRREEARHDARLLRQAVRRGLPPHVCRTPAETKCREDRVPLAEIGECVKRFKQSRFLIVGAGQAGQERDFLGAKGIYVGFDEFKALYEKVDRDEAAEWGRRWSKQAEKVVEAQARVDRQGRRRLPGDAAR